MIQKDEIVAIGKFQKTHGLKGELNALLDVEGDYANDGNPLIVDVDGIFVPFYAESVRSKGTESFLVKLRGVDSNEKAREFVNKEVFGLRKDLVEYFDDPDAELTADFVGFCIVDRRFGEVGTITDIDDSTANVLFIVESPDGRTLYIPVAEEFIVAVDDEKQTVETSLPDGLIDLNETKNE